FQPDLLHLHLPNPSAFWLMALPEARRIPWLVHWHADVPDDARHMGVRIAARPYRLLESRLLRQARAVVATSASYRDGSTALQQATEKVRVIGLAAPPPPAVLEAAPPAWPVAGLRLLAVGRLSYYNGFDVLLRAVARVPSVSLLLVG